MAVKFSEFATGTIDADLELVGFDSATPENVQVSYGDIKNDILSSFIGSNIYNTDGTLTAARTLTSGGFPLTFTGSNTAATAIARGLNLTHTLVAAANNDVLVGLDINPTFTNGAFTGVSNYSLAVSRSNASSIYTSMAIGNIATGNILNAEAARLEFRNGAKVLGGIPTARISYICTTTDANYPENAALDIYAHPTIRGMRMTFNALTFDLTSTFASQINQTSGYFIQGTGGTGDGLGTAVDTVNHRFRFNGYWAETVGNTTAMARWYNGQTATYLMHLHGTGNLVIGVNAGTDAGYKLDVNGTAKVNYNIAGGVTAVYFGSTGTGAAHLRIMGNGEIRIGSSTFESPIFSAFGNSGNISVSGYNIGFYSVSQNSQTTASGGFFNVTGINNYISSGHYNNALFLRTFIPTSGTATFNNLQITSIINQTGGANGITRGVYINPTLTAAADWRAIEITSGGVYINTTSVSASAILQADSTTKGFLPPRMTNTEVLAIATPAEGLVVYNTTISHLCCYQAGAWQKLNNSPM